MAHDTFEGSLNAKANGVTLAYREQGQGEAVVFVHGAISDMRTWQQQLPGVGARYRAIAYSRRYARPNQDIERGVDDPMLPHVDDLVAFLTSIDAAPAHLVGNSWGGFISLLVAIRHPELVRSLVLEEAPVVPLLGLSFPPRPLETLSLLFRSPLLALELAKGGARAFDQAGKAFARGDDESAVELFATGAVGGEAYRQLPEARKQQMRENKNTLREMLLGAGFPPLAEEDVRGVTVPTLLVTGERSPAGAIILTDCLAKLLPNVERISIPDASHLMHEENAPAVNEAIVGFIGRHSGVSA